MGKRSEEVKRTQTAKPTGLYPVLGLLMTAVLSIALMAVLANSRGQSKPRVELFVPGTAYEFSSASLKSQTGSVEKVVIVEKPVEELPVQTSESGAALLDSTALNSPTILDQTEQLSVAQGSLNSAQEQQSQLQAMTDPAYLYDLTLPQLLDYQTKANALVDEVQNLVGQAQSILDIIRQESLTTLVQAERQRAEKILSAKDQALQVLQDEIQVKTQARNELLAKVKGQFTSEYQPIVVEPEDITVIVETLIQLEAVDPTITMGGYSLSVWSASLTVFQKSVRASQEGVALALESGNVEDTLVHVVELDKLMPNLGLEARMQVAQTVLRQGDLDLAHRLALQILSVDKNYPGVAGLLGEIDRAQMAIDQHQEELQQTAELLRSARVASQSKSWTEMQAKAQAALELAQKTGLIQEARMAQDLLSRAEAKIAIEQQAQVQAQAKIQPQTQVEPELQIQIKQQVKQELERIREERRTQRARSFRGFLIGIVDPYLKIGLGLGGIPSVAGSVGILKIFPTEMPEVTAGQIRLSSLVLQNQTVIKAALARLGQDYSEMNNTIYQVVEVLPPAQSQSQYDFVADGQTPVVKVVSQDDEAQDLYLPDYFGDLKVGDEIVMQGEKVEVKKKQKE